MIGFNNSSGEIRWCKKGIFFPFLLHLQRGRWCRQFRHFMQVGFSSLFWLLDGVYPCDLLPFAKNLNIWLWIDYCRPCLLSVCRKPSWPGVRLRMVFNSTHVFSKNPKHPNYFERNRLVPSMGKRFMCCFGGF